MDLYVYNNKSEKAVIPFIYKFKLRILNWFDGHIKMCALLQHLEFDSQSVIINFAT